MRSAALASSRFRARIRPGLVILLVAPFFGEGLSGATPPLDLLLPWKLALMVALYGCGALVIREIARRWDLGFAGLCLLGAAYGVYEEALVDRYWFYPKFWHDSGIGTYSAVWHTNVLLACHLTAFHAAVSMCSSIVVVERLFPHRRTTPWAGRRGLPIAALALALVPVFYGEFDRRPPAPVLLAAGALVLLLVLAAFGLGRLPRKTATPLARRRGLGPIAFIATTTHWIAVYAMPSTQLPWPAGVLISLLPLVLGAVMIRRSGGIDAYGPDGMRVVSGILTFFVLLDIGVGLAGRYDLALSGLLVGALLVRWHRRQVRAQRPRPDDNRQCDVALEPPPD